MATAHRTNNSTPASKYGIVEEKGHDSCYLPHLWPWRLSGLISYTFCLGIYTSASPLNSPKFIDHSMIFISSNVLIQNIAQTLPISSVPRTIPTTSPSLRFWIRNYIQDILFVNPTILNMRISHIIPTIAIMASPVLAGPAGAALPAIVACNTALGTCAAKCAAVLLAPTA